MDFNIPNLMPMGIDEVLVEENRDERLRNIAMNTMKAYLRTRNIGSFHIETYEESIDNICEKVENTYIPIGTLRPSTSESGPIPVGESGFSIRFKRVELKKPDNTPISCQMRSLHYVGKLVGDAVFVDEFGNEYTKDNQSPSQVSICELPVMVRSKYCLLHEIYQRYEDVTDKLISLRTGGQADEIDPVMEELRKVGDEMKNLGADPADPGKYFILDGIPRIILMTEKLRLNIPYVYMKEGNTVLSLSAWSPRPIPSKLEITSENIHKKNDDEDLFSQIKLNNSMFDTSGKTMIDFFHVFRMLGVDSEEDIITILSRIYPTYDDPKRISTFHTIVAFCSPSLKISYPSDDKGDSFLDTIISTAFKKNIPNVYPKNDSEIRDQKIGSRAWAQRILCLNLMPYMKLAGEDFDNFNWYDPSDKFIKIYSSGIEKKVHSRIYNLAILLIKYCLVRLGELPPSNRDSWENKRLVTSGERFTTQFHWSFIRTTVPDKTSKEFSTTISESLKNAYDKNKENLTEYIKKKKIDAYDLLQIVKIGGVVPGCESTIDEGNAVSVIKGRYTKADVSLTCSHDPSVIIPVILEDYWNAFKRRGWGIRGKDSYWEKDVTDTLNVNQSDLHTYNQLCQIVVRTNDQNKNIQPRMVQESQFGFVCPVVSPEGENIGNTKQIAIGTVVSKMHLKQSDLKIFVNLLLEKGAPKLYKSWSGNETLSRLIYNGCFVGLCNATDMKKYLVTMRATNRFFRDSCIFVDDMFQVVVTTDSSRLLRPVFRLDEETGIPMFMGDAEQRFAEKIYLTSVDYKIMEARGYIDYIDACEQLAGFYYEKFGTPKFIKSTRDVPLEERSLDKLFKPFPTGLLIADSIWDIFSMRDKATLSMNRVKILSKIREYLKKNPKLPIYQTIRENLIKLAFAALIESKEELIGVNKQLEEISQELALNVGFNSEDPMGQGKLIRSAFGDSIKSLVFAKNNIKRDMDTKTVMTIVDEYLQEEIQNNKKLLLDTTIQSRYTHASIHPAMMYSAVALDIPYLSHIHGPRANLASKFNQQPLRGRHMNHDVLMPGEVKVLESPEVPLVVTSSSGMTGMAHHPTGQNVIVAVACFDGENQEDALIFNRQSIEQGMFKYSRYYTEVLSNDTEELNMFGTEMYHKSTSKRSHIRFGLNDAIHNNMTIYRHISRKGGLPKPGIFLNPRDCIIAAYENDEIDRSIYVKEDGAGYVDRVTVTRNFAGNPVVKVRIRQVLEPIVGDKFASRHAQKATIGRIADAEDMPYVKETGLRPDIIINPACLPSRQTVGQVLEMVAAKAALLKGERVVADVYQKPDVDNIIKTLRQYNYDETGKEILTDPKTGLPFSTKVLIGPCYYQALKHQVKFKMQSREGVGATDNITGQPVGGRQIKGGTRQGTMESAILTMADSMAYHQCMVADAYPTKVCGTCGMVTAPQSSCVAITCKFCSSVSATRLTTLLEEIDMNGMEKFHQILLDNFRDSEKIKSDPQVQAAKEIVDASENITDSIPEALFPRAKIFEGRTANEVTKVALRTYWKTMVEVGTGMGIYKEKIPSSAIRPIIEEDWKTIVIPQSSLVFFRYMSQVGFNAKFKFDPEKMNVLDRTKENQIKAAIQSKKNEPVQSVFAFARKTFPEVNFAKGTSAWYLVHQIANQ